jgi:hypothetical protein
LIKEDLVGKGDECFYQSFLILKLTLK